MTGGSVYILPAIVAVTLFLIIMMATRMTSKQESTRERIQRLAGSGIPVQPTETEIEDPLTQNQEMSSLGVLLEGILRATGVNIEKFKKENGLRFYQSGIQSADGPIFYLFFKRIGFILFLVLAYVIVSKEATGMTRVLHYLVALILITLAILGPNMMLTNKREKREKVLQRSFPDALDLLLVCVESGLALDGALSRVCKELGRAHPMITQELNRTRLELTLLNDRAQALTNLSLRTGMLCFRSLVTTLLQSEKFGTSLTDTLRVLSEDFRNTRLMLAEEKAGRLPVLMTIPLITLLIPALFLIILGPAVMNIIKVFSGK